MTIKSNDKLRLQFLSRVVEKNHGLIIHYG